MENTANKVSNTFIGQEVNEEEIDLRALWETIYRRKWDIVSLSGIIVLLTILIVFNLTPIYQATATLLIEPKDAQVVSIEQIYGVNGAGSEYLLTQFELLKSRELAEKVILELDLLHHPEFDPRQQPSSLIDLSGFISGIKAILPLESPQEQSAEEIEAEIFDQVVLKFMDVIEVAPIRKTQLVKVSVQLADAKLATAAANALVNGYISSQLDARVSMTLTATNWMNKRLTELKAQLSSSELILQSYREKENLLDINGVTGVSAEELALTSELLATARKERGVAESEYRQVQAMKKSGWRNLATVPAVIRDVLIQQFKGAEAQARTKVDELARRYGDKHPKMRSARAELKTASSNLRQQVQVVVSSIERQFQLASSSERSLKSSVSLNKGDIQAINRKEFKLRELKRETDVDRALYDTFLTQLKETSATTDIDTANARVVDKAVLPNKPIKPKKSLIVALSGFLSLMLGVGLVLLFESLHNTFKGTEDVESHLHLPVLGILPLVIDKTREQIAQLVVTNKDKSYSESLRSIRTGVVLSGLDNPHKVIVVTSSIPGEGKSCVSSSLAFALGQMEKVLLVDADMRRPSIAKNFDFPVGTPGLANVVADTATLEESIQTVNGIDILSAGIVPPNPLELLSTKRFASLMDELDQRYDRIIIDSPPVQAVSDALVLSTFANAVIFVVKSDSTAIPLAKKAVGQLLQHKAALAGVVLNSVDIEKAQKYGYTYGGYYDYYGYNGDAKA